MTPTVDEKIFPAVFVSHGAPTLALEQNETVTFLGGLGKALGRPRAILCVSAHWTTSRPQLSTAERPETIHDFGGFPDALYRMRYDAPGAPDVAERAAALLAREGFEAGLAARRGLDHGAWIPLRLMYPEADIPVTQLSVQPQAGPVAHLRIGRALAPLRREGVLILATGGIVHNLAALGREGATPVWAAEFDDWVRECIAGGSCEQLVDYRRLAPNAAAAQPTEEHLLPLFVAMGAGAPESAGGAAAASCGESIHRGWTYGSLSMAAYRFGA